MEVRLATSLELRFGFTDETMDQHLDCLEHSPGSLMSISKRLLFLTTILFSTALLYGQTALVTPAPLWVMVTQESTSTAVVLPAGTTYRFGNAANNLWSAPITVTEPTTFSPVFFPAGVFPFSDPDSGVAKELDVLQTSTPQTVQVTNLAVSPATTIGLIIQGLPPTTVPMTPGTAYTVTFSGFAIPTTAPQNAPMVAFVNAPTSMANQAWEGTQMNVMIDGATLVCTLGTGNTAQAFTLNCTVPAAAGN